MIDFAKEARELRDSISANAYPAADGSADIDNHALPIIEVTLREIARRAVAEGSKAGSLPMTNSDDADPRLTNPGVDRSLTILEGMADAWAVEIDLPAMVRNIVSPMRLNRSVPNEVREDFIARMKRQIDALIKQAWIEGAYQGCTGAFDAVRAGYDPTRSGDGEQSISEKEG